MLQNKGVKFHMKTELCELKGKDGKVSHTFVIPELLILGEKKPKLSYNPVPTSGFPLPCLDPPFLFTEHSSGLKGHQ